MSTKESFALRRSGIALGLFSLICLWGSVPLRAETPVLEQLKKQFNEDKGVLRLVVLVSPTCPACVSGAGWIQEYVLKRNPDLDVKVYAVWYEMYPGDSPDDFPEARKQMKDKRVTHYWDDSKDVGRWYFTAVPGDYKGPIQWDAFYLYGADSVWEDQPTSLLTWGRTILEDRKNLTAQIASLTGAAPAADDYQVPPGVLPGDNP
jgi:hypothetical protein